MKTPLSIAAGLVLAAAMSLTANVAAQGTSFTYQGRLNSSGSPYSGSAEFQPTLWDALSGGAQVAANTPTTVILHVGKVEVYQTGTILGKALEPLGAGKGVIKALVTLRQAGCKELGVEATT